MAFAPKTGCPMCGIVASSVHAPSNSPRSPSFPVGSTQPEVLWRDDNFTAYREKANPVSSKGHIIIAFKCSPCSFNLHSLIYRPPSPRQCQILGNSPVDFHATALFTHLNTSDGNRFAFRPLHSANAQFRIGFITGMFSDSKIPIKDHLHAHAYIGPPDLMGWWRAKAYGPLSWYPIDDLIAEIRESVTNNRIKSGYENRAQAPIDMVPHAGARAGTADGIETTEPGLANPDADLEGGEGTPTVLTPRTATLSPQNLIPSIRV